jgi:hypothetical protein
MCTKIIGYSKDRISFGCPFVNNHDYVKLNIDIEDLSRDAIKCCSKLYENISNKPLEYAFQTPAEYFKFLYKNKNETEQ